MVGSGEEGESSSASTMHSMGLGLGLGQGDGEGRSPSYSLCTGTQLVQPTQYGALLPLWQFWGHLDSGQSWVFLPEQQRLLLQQVQSLLPMDYLFHSSLSGL